MNLPQTFTGEIIHGFGRGHKMLGFATANVSGVSWHVDVPEAAYGVYDGLVRIRGEPPRIGVVSVGKNETFDAMHPTFEVHILDFDEDIYGVTIEVELRTYLRPMIQFKSIDELIQQIAADCKQAREHITRILNEKQ